MSLCRRWRVAHERREGTTKGPRGNTSVGYQPGEIDPNRRDIAVRRRDGANNALRSSPDPIGALDKMVLAQSLGDADRQAARHEKGDRRPGTSPGRDHASHLG